MKSRSGPRHDARSVALDVLSAVEKGGFLQPSLEGRVRKTGIDARERRLALELVMGVLRWRAALDHQLGPYLRAGFDGTDVLLVNLIRMAMYQIRFLDRIPPHAAVDTAVELARGRRGRGPSRFVNGVLRAWLRGDEIPLPDDPAAALSIEQSHPIWLVERWIDTHGFEEAKALAEANNRSAPLTIRPQGAAPSRDALHQRLESEGAKVELGSWAPDALRIVSHPQPFEGPSFKDGWWGAQDEASQLVVRMLGPRQGEKIWDACAAPGGKTRYVHRLVSGEARILATDSHRDKVAQMQASLAGLGITVQCSPIQDVPPELFDRVLVDAPCSALGLVHRHPEIRWRRWVHDIARCAAEQASILRTAAKAVRPGGILVYSVCSTTVEEGPDQIREFLAQHSDYALEEPDDPSVDWEGLLENGTLQTTPHRHGADGFFAARMRRGDNS